MESPAAMLARRLAEDAEAVCRHYLPNGRRQGRYWIAGDVENSRGRSLYVRLTGPTSGPGAAGRWTDAATGVACKCRPDWHSEDRRLVVDVKTTRDASRAEFARSIAGFDYHLQAAWNLRALEAEQFLIIAVENVRPFAVGVYPVSGAMLAAGDRRIRAALDQLAECQRTGHWPGYGDTIADPIDLPGWCRD